MGYTTDFYGEVTISPPLRQEEIDYLTKFAETRRMNRKNGPYHLGSGDFGQGNDPDIIDFNSPPEGQPGLWCQWTPIDAETIAWDGGEKFYEATSWMAYIIDHFLKPGAEASKSGDPQFDGFTFDHTVNGEIEAQGEDPDDEWKLIVRDNVVYEAQGIVSYGEPEAVNV